VRVVLQALARADFGRTAGRPDCARSWKPGSNLRRAISRMPRWA